MLDLESLKNSQHHRIFGLSSQWHQTPKDPHQLKAFQLLSLKYGHVWCFLVRKFPPTTELKGKHLPREPYIYSIAVHCCDCSFMKWPWFRNFNGSMIPIHKLCCSPAQVTLLRTKRTLRSLFLPALLATFIVAGCTKGHGTVCKIHIKHSQQ